ncbi:MAG TPA: YggS family pyridoxal phosphate-dependent enzyme [Actinomycetota bacterium]|nr:YggS family pyridoxal phosphate-dependent enzyme [Actinomycetota bacterium]
MTRTRERLHVVRNNISIAAKSAGRDPTGVTLVAISKTFPAERVIELRDEGVSDFGENRAQELEAKLLEVPDVRWHFVGHLQTNKARVVTGAVTLIHSIDGIRLAEAVSRRAVRLERDQDVLIEVNISGESTKSGVAPSDAIALARRVGELPNVAVKGLMTIPGWPEDPEDSRPAYKTMAELGRALGEVIPGATELSMGMSRDYEVAVQEGATIVRVGEALFGPRTAART